MLGNEEGRDPALHKKNNNEGIFSLAWNIIISVN